MFGRGRRSGEVVEVFTCFIEGHPSFVHIIEQLLSTLMFNRVERRVILREFNEGRLQACRTVNLTLSGMNRTIEGSGWREEVVQLFTVGGLADEFGRRG